MRRLGRIRCAVRAGTLAALCLVGAAVAGAQVPADPKARADREELERLRAEREELQQRRLRLQSTLHDLSEEVTLLDKQADMTARLVRSLDQQLRGINAQVEQASDELKRAENELALKRAVVQRRLVDIYKRGPLYSFEVMLSAGTFASLVSRYKYLHLVAQRDRDLMVRVQALRDSMESRRTALARFQANLELARAEKADEERKFRDLEREREGSLASTRRSAEETETRLRSIARDELRLGQVIAALEVTRRRDERLRPDGAPAGSTLRTADLGRLDWPVEGTIIYSFGRVVNPNNTTTRWNGIGISASHGAPVRSVAAGRVVVAAPFGTYGQTVILQHGGGDYSVYGSLSRIEAQKGVLVSKGQVVGYVGNTDPTLPPHLHFEMRPQGRAVDPLEWLRGVR